MNAGEEAATTVWSASSFDEFYDHALPIVFGYVLRLCGGDRDEAWDLTQDSWTAVVTQINDGRTDCVTVAYLLTVARSRYLDAWRRRQRLQRKLRLVWAGDREREATQVSLSNVLEHVTACSPTHRAVLMMAYVDDLPVADIARQLGCSRASAYSLLGRAREELRSHITENRDD